MQSECTRGDCPVLRGAQRVKKRAKVEMEISPHYNATRQHASTGASCTREIQHRVSVGILKIWAEVGGFGKDLAQILMQPLHCKPDPVKK